MTGFFVELSLIILAATVMGTLARLLKQPVILAYVAVGIILGPIGFAIVRESENLVLFSQIGVALLLFIVGMSLNPRHLKDVGKISLITGLGQVLFTSIFGFLISMGLGFGIIESVYISVALTFSSTIIIVKLLTDKRELDTLYGRIAVGFLLVQDFIAVLALVLISGLKPDVGLSSIILLTLGKGILLFLGVWLIYLTVIKPSFSFFSKNQELLFLGSIAWCFVVAVAAMKLGFTLEIGAFLAGLALASSELGLDVGAKIRPLRDFFIALFFINLGISMTFSSVMENIWPIIIFSLFILVGNPIIVFFIMSIMGYRSRTSFLAGLTVAQISEFSLILMSAGFIAGHVGKDATILVTTIGVITITASTYLILYGSNIYNTFSGALKYFERKKLKERIEHKNINKRYDVILFGCHRMGYNVVEKTKGKKILVVDFNPEIIRKLTKAGFDGIYADLNDSEVIEELTKTRPKFVISTIPSLDINKRIIKNFKEANPKCVVFATTKNALDYLELYKVGADFIAFPELLAGQKIADYMVHLNANKMKKWGKIYYDKFIEDLRSGKLVW